jgi:hypothetical protein
LADVPGPDPGIMTHGPPPEPPCSCYDCTDCEVGNTGLCQWPTGKPWVCDRDVLGRNCPGVSPDAVALKRRQPPRDVAGCRYEFVHACCDCAFLLDMCVGRDEEVTMRN